MSKKGVVILPPKGDDNDKLFGETMSMSSLLNQELTSKETMGEIGALYDYVSDPQVHIKDKINSLLKLHMFFSREILIKPEIDYESVQIYRVRREAVADLKRLVELLNEYSAVDNFDTEHPLYSKTLNLIMEAILTSVKENVESTQFDSIVREIAISLPLIESRIKNMIVDSTTEDLLAMRENPLMDALNNEKGLFKEYLTHRVAFKEYLNGLDDVQ